MVDPLPPSALAAWSWPGPVQVVPVHDGLINPTWLVHGAQGPVGVLQELNTRIFQPTVHEDIEAVTAHLAAKGLPTPRLVRTRAGGLWHEDDGRVLRVLTHVGDRTLHRVAHLDEAREAGALVGRFHRAVDDLDWTYRHVRPGPHDTARHARLLDEALAAHPTHRHHDAVARLADELRAGWAGLQAELPPLPLRHIHGDLKVSNLRFLGPRAHALIDLDTLARDTLGSELGDALRSWCGTAGEDVAEARFDLDVLEAALAGYAAEVGDTLPDGAWGALVPSVQRIATELAMRFAADALHETYFGWDPTRFATRGDHDLVRAQGQASLARAIAGARGEAEARLRRIRPTAGA
ncbi:MAG: phosphotransferase [Alphaproteobacteria bacterium]|nr:phosphotransferase [Alphaproteobacteria bacterium]